MTIGKYLDHWMKDVEGTVRESTHQRYGEWAMLGSNQRPLPCEGSALPLS